MKFVYVFPSALRWGDAALQAADVSSGSPEDGDSHAVPPAVLAARPRSVLCAGKGWGEHAASSCVVLQGIHKIQRILPV